MEWDFLVRFLCAFLAGGLLSIAGSLVQNFTHNDLAGPSTLGFEALIVLIILMGHFIGVFWLFDTSEETISLFLFIVCLTVLFWQRKRIDFFLSNQSMILIGLCFNLFVGAIFSLLQFLFFSLSMEFPTQIWFGNFRYIADGALPILILTMMMSIYFVIRFLKTLTLVGFGKEFSDNFHPGGAKELGRFSWGLALVLTGIVTIYFGVFSFTSLIFPHLARRIPFFRYSLKNELLIWPLIAGGIFASLDYSCREFLFYNTEIPVGMVSSILGAAILMGLVIHNQKSKHL
ncbi:MAG: iron chelate uptake ABC transporter family permease subunit [Bacteriovoracaceae bacterium]